MTFSAGKLPVQLMITDLDNTLFDWLDVWAASFSAMLEQLSDASGVPKGALEDEFRAVHQRHGTVEYALAINELPSLTRLHPNADLAEVYSDAVDAFRTARRERLRLYPGVIETLERIRQSGCRLVGYTESIAFYSAYRIKKLGLDVLLDRLYSPQDHDFPAGITPEQLRRYPPEHYELRRTTHFHTPVGERKPNAAILKSIVAEMNCDVSETAYVGDSLLKDVLMAQQADVADVWAKYGYSPARPEYELLKRVTHWTAEDVAHEKALSSHDVKPTYVLERSFSELLDLFAFRAAGTA
jgi:phosphoglycolate phosphatase-like HAD superfamily hydrolase